MADALTKYAEFLKRGSMPLVADSDGVLRDMYLRQPKKPLETNMDFAGAEITAIDPVEKPLVQDLAETVIQADAPSEREDKYKVLNRMLKLGNIYEDRVQPDPERVKRLDADLESLRKRSGSAPRKLDLSDIEAEMKTVQKGQNEWSGDDYLKAALVAILPSVAGGIMGGLGGAAGAAPAGVEGLKMALQQKKDKADSSVSTLKNKAAMRVAQFNAESQDEARQIKALLDRVDTELKVTGTLSKPTEDFVKSFLSNMRGLEGQLYGQDIQADLGEAAEAGRESRARLAEEGTGQRAEAKLEAEMKKADLDRLSREKMAAADRASREKIAGKKAAVAAKTKQDKPATADERTSASYLIRMQESDPSIEQFFKTPNFDATSRRELVRELPQGDLLYKVVKNQDAQRFYNAVRSFINSVMRKESGAAIAESEFSSARDQYIPGPGDTAETIAQKRRNRQAAMAGMRASAGEKASSAAESAMGTFKALDPRIEAVAKDAGIDYETAKAALIKRYRAAGKEFVPNEQRQVGQ